MAKRITTVFVRDDSVNVAVLDGQNVQKWATAPVEDGAVQQGAVADEAKVTAAIREALKQADAHPSKVIAGVGGASSLYRMITLPEMPDALLAEAVRREARRVLPISLDDVYLSYQAVPAVSRGERRLFLATYPKNATDAMVRSVRAAGPDPYLMDLAPLALSRVPNEPRAIIISVRAGQADIIIVEDRIPQLIRVLTLPTEAASITDKLPAISEELTRTITFYNSSHAEKPINPEVPLFVAGELADASDSWPHLVGRLNFKVAPMPVPVQSPPEFPANDFMVNIGLALKEFASDRPGDNFSSINLNVLPEVYQPKRVPVSRVVMPVLGIVAVGVLVYMATFVVRGRADTNKLQDQVAASEPPIAAQTKQIATLKTQVGDVPKQFPAIDAQVSAVKATANTFTSTKATLDNSRAKIDSDLKDRVVGLLPFYKENLSLTSVGHDGSTIAVTGTAADQTQIFAYTRALRQSGGISSVIINQIQAVTDQTGATTGYSFSLTLK